MVKEDALNKYLYKILIVSLKIIPMVLAICYTLNTVFAYFDIDTPVLSTLAGVSVFTWIFLYLSSIVFRFCSYHRMFLYYIAIIDILNTIDYYFNIPLDTFYILMLHTIIACISLFIILYLYVKYHKQNTQEYS